MIKKKNAYALIILVERKSRLTLVSKIQNCTAEAARNAVVQIMKPYRLKTLTIICDNDREFAGHQKIAEELGVVVYFAHPYAPRERRTNENSNGLLSSTFLFNSSNFSKITDEKVQFTQNRLEQKPRKRLNVWTPEKFFPELVKLHLRLESKASIDLLIHQ